MNDKELMQEFMKYYVIKDPNKFYREISTTSLSELMDELNSARSNVVEEFNYGTFERDVLSYIRNLRNLVARDRLTTYTNREDIEAFTNSLRNIDNTYLLSNKVEYANSELSNLKRTGGSLRRELHDLATASISDEERTMKTFDLMALIRENDEKIKEKSNEAKELQKNVDDFTGLGITSIRDKFLDDLNKVINLISKLNLSDSTKNKIREANNHIRMKYMMLGRTGERANNALSGLFDRFGIGAKDLTMIHDEVLVNAAGAKTDEEFEVKSNVNLVETKKDANSEKELALIDQVMVFNGLNAGSIAGNRADYSKLERGKEYKIVDARNEGLEVKLEGFDDYFAISCFDTKEKWEEKEIFRTEREEKLNLIGQTYKYYGTKNSVNLSDAGDYGKLVTGGDYKIEDVVFSDKKEAYVKFEGLTGYYNLTDFATPLVWEHHHPVVNNEPSDRLKNHIDKVFVYNPSGIFRSPDLEAGKEYTVEDVLKGGFYKLKGVDGKFSMTDFVSKEAYDKEHKVDDTKQAENPVNENTENKLIVKINGKNDSLNSPVGLLHPDKEYEVEEVIENKDGSKFYKIKGVDAYSFDANCFDIVNKKKTETLDNGIKPSKKSRRRKVTKSEKMRKYTSVGLGIAAIVTLFATANIAPVAAVIVSASLLGLAALRTTKQVDNFIKKFIHAKIKTILNTAKEKIEKNGGPINSDEQEIIDLASDERFIRDFEELVSETEKAAEAEKTSKEEQPLSKEDIDTFLNMFADNEERQKMTDEDKKKLPDVVLKYGTNEQQKLYNSIVLDNKIGMPILLITEAKEANEYESTPKNMPFKI